MNVMPVPSLSFPEWEVKDGEFVFKLSENPFLNLRTGDLFDATPAVTGSSHSTPPRIPRIIVDPLADPFVSPSKYVDAFWGLRDAYETSAATECVTQNVQLVDTGKQATESWYFWLGQSSHASPVRQFLNQVVSRGAGWDGD